MKKTFFGITFLIFHFSRNVFTYFLLYYTTLYSKIETVKKIN